MHNDHQTPPEDGADEAELSLETPLSVAQAELAAAKAEQMRLLAEMDNQRKRAQRDLEAARKYGVERLVGDLLPVLDNLDRAVKSEISDIAKLRTGVDLTIKMLSRAMDGHGLTVLDPVGENFNPEWHQAVNMVETGAHAPGTVVEVLQKGYRLHDRLLRPAMVAVATDPPPPEDA